MQQTYAAPESPPGTLKAWAAIAIGGSLLTGLLGIVVIIAGAAVGSSADLQNQLSGAVPGGFHITGGLIAGFGVGIFIFGLAWAGVNWFLYRNMAQHQQWAWIVALVLLALGALLDLVGHSGGSFIHLLVIQIPLGVLLLLNSTRQWIRAGATPAYSTAASEGYGASPPPPSSAPPAPPPLAPSGGFAGAAPPPAPETAEPPAPADPEAATGETPHEEGESSPG